jgi:hypothetical protein
MRAEEFIIEQKEYTKNGFQLKVVVEALQQLDEALKLNAPHKVIAHADLHDYLGRIHRGEKTKQDKFKSIIHKSNIKITKSDNPDDLWDLDDLAKQIMKRPGGIIGKNAKMTKSAKGVLGKNQKMTKSSGGDEIFFDITLPALKGIVMDEETGDFVEISTCPSAGECQLYCYARKGGYVMFPKASMSAARLLNFLVNDPEGFEAMVNHEIAKNVKTANKKGNTLIVRWHDAGDFFSKEYAEVAFDIARANPDIMFYAYTKSSDIALVDKPDNFITRFSTGAHPTDKSKIAAHKETGKHVLQAHTIPREMFKDLIVSHGKGYEKDESGMMKFKSDQAFNDFKSRIAKEYHVDPKSIITYDDMLKLPVGNIPKWNVLTFPNHGDKAAYRKDVLNSFLIFH